MNLKKKIYWIAALLLTILGLIFTEGSLIATTKAFGVMKATLIRVAFTIPLSWLAIFLCLSTKTSANVRNWFLAKQASLSSRARLAVKGGEFFVIVSTAVLLGPILASILMIMIGVQGKRLYLYAVLCALLCALAWSSLYSGMCWGIGKIWR